MSARRHFAPLLLVPLVAAFLLWLFVWPAARLAPRDLDLGLTGPDAAVTAAEHRLTAEAGPHAFDLHRYADPGSARRAVEHRDVYGALVLQGKGTTLFTASAASPAVSNLLRQTLAAPGAAGAGAVKVVDVVPMPPADPRGGALGAVLLPMLVTATASAALSARRTRSLPQRIAVSLGTAVGSGLVAVGVTQGWLGILDGNWAADAGVFALASFAVTSVVTGLASLGRAAGLTGGAAAMVLVGNAYSGNASAPELLPRDVAWIGRLLPAGAGSDALRDVAFFDGHGVTLALFVLGLWSLIGLALITTGTLRAGARNRTHLHGAHARRRRPMPQLAAAEGVEGVEGVEGAEGAEGADGGCVQLIRSVPIDPAAGVTGTVGLEVTVVARMDARRTAPTARVLEPTTAG